MGGSDCHAEKRGSGSSMEVQSFTVIVSSGIGKVLVCCWLAFSYHRLYEDGPASLPLTHYCPTPFSHLQPNGSRAGVHSLKPQAHWVTKGAIKLSLWRAENPAGDCQRDALHTKRLTLPPPRPPVAHAFSMHYRRPW